MNPLNNFSLGDSSKAGVPTCNGGGRGMSPRRIQRKRTKGWRMPDGALSVTRPSMFGNPFIVGKHGDACQCVEKFRRLMTTNDHKEAVLLCEEFTSGERVTRHLRVGGSLVPYSWSPGSEKADYYLCFRHQIIAACRGRDLACYCALDKPCHADVLLELANPSSASETPAPQEGEGAASNASPEASPRLSADTIKDVTRLRPLEGSGS